MQDLLYLLKVSSAGGTLIKLLEMGDEPLYPSNPEGFPPQSGPLAGRDTST